AEACRRAGNRARSVGGDLPPPRPAVRQGVRDSCDGCSREPSRGCGAELALRAPADPLKALREGGRAGSPPARPELGAAAGYFAGGVTCTCMKPPGVTLVTRIDVPVFGTLTLFHSAW